MKVKMNEDQEYVVRMREALHENDGYCPCALMKVDDTKCMCKEFREQTTPGYCHCKLYEKVEE